MEVMVEQFQERQVAIKVKISEILNGKYIVEEGWTPNYLLTQNNQKISRVNIFGVILETNLEKERTNLILDDGSGKMAIRSFEELKNLNLLNVGDSIVIIGKIRFFNGELYLSPEIIKKIDPKWLKIRKIELDKLYSENPIPIAKLDLVKESLNEEIEEDSIINQKVQELIKELDLGGGVLIEEIKEKSDISNIETVIEFMLKNGEIFQNLPGRVKLL